MSKPLILLGTALILSSFAYYFLSSNLELTSETGIHTDGLGRVIEYSFARDWTDKAAMIALFLGGVWVIRKSQTS